MFFNLFLCAAWNGLSLRTELLTIERDYIMIINTYNWQEIQAFHDAGNNWREIRKHFGVSMNTLANATKIGLFKSRSSGQSSRLTWEKSGRTNRRHTPESKEKLRQARLKYLAANPDKASWKTKDKFRSIPCEKVKTELRTLGIAFIEELMPLLHKKRFFSADIAFPEKMIIFDINGSQHYDTNGNLKPYYQERHDLIEAEGWKLYEVPYHSAMRESFVSEFILPIINGATNIPCPLFHVKGKVKYYCSCGNIKWRTSICCRKCNNKKERPKKVKYPSKEVLHWLVWNYPSSIVANQIGVADSFLCKKCKELNIQKPPRGFWNKMKEGYIIDYQI